MSRDQFTFYASFARAIGRIKKATDRCLAYDILIAYALDGEEPDLDTLPESVAMFFDLTRPVLDTAARKSKGGKTPTRPEEDNGKTPTRPEEDNGKEKEGEKEKEKEKESYKPPVSPPDDFPPVLAEAFSDWLAYKKERRETYKETGLKNLTSQIRSAAAEYGDAAVVDIIRTSIASGYQGIVFDRLKRTAPPKPAPAPDSFPYNDPELARLKRI